MHRSCLTAAAQMSMSMRCRDAAMSRRIAGTPHASVPAFRAFTGSWAAGAARIPFFFVSSAVCYEDEGTACGRVWASLTDQAIVLCRPWSAGYPSAAPQPHFPLHTQRVSCQRAAPSVISSHALAFGRRPAPSRRFQNPPTPPAVVTGTPPPALRRRPRPPQLRRLQPTMVPENVRVLIVWHVVHHAMPCSEAARLFGCDPSSVYRFKATYLSTGKLWPNGER